MFGGFPAKMYLLDINPDRLISGEKQSVGVNFNLKKRLRFSEAFAFFQSVSKSQLTLTTLKPVSTGRGDFPLFTEMVQLRPLAFAR